MTGFQQTCHNKISLTFLSHAHNSTSISVPSAADLADICLKLVGWRQHMRHRVGLVLGLIKIEIHRTLHTTAGNNHSRQVMSVGWERRAPCACHQHSLPCHLSVSMCATVPLWYCGYSPLVLCLGIPLPHGHVPGAVHHTAHTDTHTNRYA